MSVAALYVDARGPYPALLGRDRCWDVTRDARRYEGPGPVVAHPPCGPWGKLRHLYRGSEHDCAPRAVDQVRRWRGVLEHPAGSLLWSFVADADGGYLPFPGEFPDRWGGFTVEVDQVEWGHVARKRTWLYCVGIPRAAITPPPFPGREPTHWVAGRSSNSTRGLGTPAPPGIKICSAQQRRRTPPLFAEWLISVASQARPHLKAAANG